MKKMHLIIYMALLSLSILFSCKENNEDFEQLTFNDLTIKTVSFSSIEVSGIVTNNTNSNIIHGGYYLGKHENVESVIYKETLNKKFCDTLSLNSNQEYWIQSFIETKTAGIITGQKIKFKTSDYKIIFEKYVTVTHEFDNLSYPTSTYSFSDCILDNDGNIILAGGMGYNPAHPFMVKIDKDGNYMWHHTFTDIPQQWARYQKVFISNTNDYWAVYVTWQSLYITKISKDGDFIAYYTIQTNTEGETTPANLYDIVYNKDDDSFILYSAITEYYSDEHIDFSFKIIRFDSSGNVTEHKKIKTNFGINKFDGKWYLVNNDRYCVGHLSNFYDGSVITKVDGGMNILCEKELLGYNVQQLAIRENDILVVATTYDIGAKRKFKFFEIDKNLTEFKELSEQWNISEPFVYDCLTDKKENVLIGGGNGYNMFNELGAMCIISNNNTFLYKEQDFGIKDLIPGKWTSTRFKFIKELPDNSILLIGEYNPNLYDGPISKVYLRKFSY